jgi:2-dehydro-3-deoxyphosphooctonate aldolase (KDO 8-P synthase)
MPLTNPFLHPVIAGIPRIRHTSVNNFFLIAGPCVIEDGINPFEVAHKVQEITNRLQIPFIFKASYRKANRSSISSFTGIGDMKALEIIKAVGDEVSIPTLTDIHSAAEAELASRFVDVLQIPAFLCRQTDILVAAAATGKTINIKKGQFLSPGAMRFPVEKVRSAGNLNMIITERGTTFGYQDLVVDFRGIPVMKELGVPVVLDVTHSLQQPNQPSGVTGGLPHLIRTLACAGIASGCDGIFLETHPDPANARSDGANMLPLGLLEELLTSLVKIRQAVI